MATTQEAFAELLSAEGFSRMAQDVRNEKRPHYLERYARIIAKNAPDDMRDAVESRLARLGYLRGYRSL